VPGEIIVRETTDSAYIYKATLKVMLEEDYLKAQDSSLRTPAGGEAISKPGLLRFARNDKRGVVGNDENSIYQFNDPRLKELNKYSTELIKELIIPKLTKEVNSSKRYASLRQVYYSLIMAQWFKARFNKHLSFTNQPNNPSNPIAQVTDLIDSKNLSNLASKTPWNKQDYFNQYQQSFTKGEYNTKETVYTPSGQVIRSYMSGGVGFQQITSSAIKSNLGIIPQTPFTEELIATFTNDLSSLNISVSSAINSTCWQGSYKGALDKIRSDPLGNNFVAKLFVHFADPDDIVRLFDTIGIDKGDTVVDIGSGCKFQIASFAALKAGRVIAVDPMLEHGKIAFESGFRSFTDIIALSLNISPRAFGNLFIEPVAIENLNLDQIKPAKAVFLLNLLDYPEESGSVQSIYESAMEIVQEGSSIIFTVDREDNDADVLFSSAEKKGFRLVERESYEYLGYGATRFEVVRANVVDSQSASSAVGEVVHELQPDKLSEKEIAEAKKFIEQLSEGNLFLSDITEEWRLQEISGRYLKALEAEKKILHDKLNKKGEGAFLEYGERYLEISNSIFFLQLYFRGILLSSLDPAYVRASKILKKLQKINRIEGKYYLLVPKSLPYLGYLYTMAQNTYLMVSEDLISSLDDDGLAWVIAHELVHCEKGHSRSGLRSMALYGDYSPDNLNFWSNFRQSQEKEADSIAFDYVVEAGYKRESSIKALETLGKLDIEAGDFIKSIVGEKTVEPSDRIPLRAQTHPSIEERVVALRRKISAGSPAAGYINDRTSSAVKGEIKLPPAFVRYIQSLPREKIMREMVFLEVLDKLLKGMAGDNVYSRINYAEALRSLIESGLVIAEDLESGIPLGNFVFELETVSGNLLLRYSELITFFINKGLVKDEELAEARQRIELNNFIIKKLQKTKQQKRINGSKLSPKDLLDRINSATSLESIQIKENAEVLSALYSSGIFTREEIRGDILPTLRNIFLNNKVAALNNKYSFGSYAYYFIRLLSLLQEDKRPLENFDKYIISGLIELSGGISIEARDLFYSRLAQLIKEGRAPDEARGTLQKELLEFYVTESQKAEIISEIKKIGVYVGRLMADIFKINGSLSTNLKKVFRLFKIELKDNGNAETAAAQIMENCLNNVPAFTSKSLMNFPKENKSFRPEVIPANELEKLLSGAKLYKRLGRTLVYQTSDGRYLALKFQKRSILSFPDRSRQENEEAASKLLYESEIFGYLYSLRQQGVLIGDYPQAQLLAGKRVVSLRENDLPQDMVDILNEPSQSSVNLNEEICIDRKDGYVTVTGYITENLDYFTYLHEAKNDAVFKQAARKNIHDLFVLAKYGIIHPDIVELFHDARSNRNYLVLVDLINSLGIDDVRGAGCLDAWKRYVSYPNMRISGPADFAELVRLEDLIDLNHKHSQYLKIDLQRFSPEQRTNLILAHFLGNYFLALALIEGRRLDNSGRLDWKNSGGLAASMRNSFSLAYEVLTGRNDDDVYKLVNWSRLAKQMALFMSGDYRYLDSVEQKKIFKVIFGLPDLKIEPGRGWGYIHQDLIVDKLRSSVRNIKDEVILAILVKYFRNDRESEPGFEKVLVFKEDFLALIQEDKINPKKSPQEQKIINVLEDLYNTYSRGWRENGKDDDLGPDNGPFPLQELVNAIYIFNTVMIGRAAVGSSVNEDTKTAAASSVAVSVAEDNIVKNKLLNKEIVDYWRIFNRQINPESGDLTVAVGAAGADVSSVWICTHFTKAYFIDYLKVNLERLQKYHEEWMQIDTTVDYFQEKYNDGYNDRNTIKGYGIEYLVMQELQAMGIKKEDVVCELDGKGRPKLTFKLPGEDTLREIIFIQRNLKEHLFDLESELFNKVDVYFEKASVDLAEYYYKLINTIKRLLKPRGFILIDGRTSNDGLLGFMQIASFGFQELTLEQAKITAMNLAMVMRKNYGWRFSSWQKKEIASSAVEVDRINNLSEAGHGLSDYLKQRLKLTRSKLPQQREILKLLPVGAASSAVPSVVRKTDYGEQEMEEKAKVSSVIANKGGIDFRALPIVTQAVFNLGLGVLNREQRVRLSHLDLNAELAEINKLLGAGITPSIERIKQCAQAAYLFSHSQEENAKIISCIAQVLRKQEDECCSTDSTLKDILVVLEAGSV
jgi:hypothetical protein